MSLRYAVIAAALAFTPHAALAQLEPFEDYDISQNVWNVTTIKVHSNMIDDYLEGLRSTWVAANEVAKGLGQIEDYAIFVSDLPNGGHFNVILTVRFASTQDLAPSKERYDAFMARWGEERVEASREISKDYPSMRKIVGEYQMREITLK